MSLILVPIKRDDAKAYVRKWHRHSPRPPAGDVLRVAVWDDEHGAIVCVGLAGRPSSRILDDGLTLEVTRVASDGIARNVVSKTYAALTKAGFAIGYKKIITYNNEGESGASLRALADLGWKVVAECGPRPTGWNTPARPRDVDDYFVATRYRWETVA